MLIAITREVSASINTCELTHLERQPIDVTRARYQHLHYRDLLARRGMKVIHLPPLDEQPDAVFVEDLAVVLDEVAIMTRPGAPTRRGEGKSLEPSLADYRPLVHLGVAATLEGGDVINLDRTLYVGRSTRTNAEGIAELREIVLELGYDLVEVTVRGCLHLKSAACALGSGRILANRDWLDTSAFKGVEIIDVARDEPRAANVLAVGPTVLMPACHPRTAELLVAQNFTVWSFDNSELLKAESGVTCSSLIFRDNPAPLRLHPSGDDIVKPTFNLS